jgi:hypothetical protein
VTDDELRRALYGLAVAISLTPPPSYSGMGAIQDREQALEMVKKVIGYTNEEWWAMKKTAP